MTTSRRGIWVALVVGLAAAGLGGSTVSAATANFQAVPATDWTQPGTGPLDGVGQWVYVAPIPPAGPGQMPTTGYLYGPMFVPSGGGIIRVALSTDGEGPLAGIQLIDHNIPSSPAPAIIRYAWSPGQFYFVLAYHLGNGLWGGWVYDYSAAAWTLIGTVQAPAGWGLADAISTTSVAGAQGEPMPPFSVAGVPGVIEPCSVFPRVDAYFYPPVGYRGTSYTVATTTTNRTALGNCPTLATVEYGWVHHRLGTLAAS